MELNKVYQGDCLSVLKDFENDSVDIVITSPPYNMGSRVKSWLQTYKFNEEDNMENYEGWICEVIRELLRVTKFHVFFNIQENSNNKGIISFLFRNFEKDLKEVFIWAKTNPPSHIVDTQCANGFEYIFCFSKDNPSSKVFSHCSFRNSGGDYVRNVIIEGVHRDELGHNYAFPEWLPAYFIRYFAIKGDIILDPFCGSGTTCYIAKTRGFSWVGIDISAEYCKISENRLNQETLLSFKQAG